MKNLITIENLMTTDIRIRLGHGSEQAQLQSSLQEQQRVRSGAGLYLISMFGYLTSKTSEKILSF